MARREKIILEADDRASKDIGRVEQSYSRFGDTVRKVTTGAVIGIGVAGIGRFAKTLFDAGTETEEAAAAFETTFGNAVAGASRFVEDFANKAGFTERALQQQFATIGNVIQGLGGTERAAADLGERMIRLSGDVASFNNIAAGGEPVLEALRSALGGEREALKTYGIAISEAEVVQRALIETGKTHEDQLTRLDKANATVTLAYDKANKAVGDLDRTQDSAANRARELGARWDELIGTLGQKALPVFEQVLDLLDASIGFLERQGFVLQRAANQWDRFWAAAASAAKADANRIVGAFDVILGPFINFGEQTADVEQATIDIVQGILTATSALEQGVDPARAFAIGLQEMADRGTSVNRGLEEYAARLGLGNEATRDAAIFARGHADALGLTALDVESLNALIAVSTREIIANKLATMDEAAAVRTAGGAWAVGADEADFWARKTREAGAAADAAATDTRTLGERIRDVSSAYREAADPIFGAVAAYQGYLEVLEEAGEPSERTAQQQLDVAEAALDAQAALAGLGDGNLVAGIDAIAAAIGTNRGQVAEFLVELGILDGSQVRVLFDVGFTAGSQSRLTAMGRLAGGEIATVIGGIAAAQHGGFVNIPERTAMPVLVHGQERILTADQNRMFERLIAAVGSAGAGTSSTSSVVNVTLNAGDERSALVQETVTDVLDRAALTHLLSGLTL